MDPIADFLTIIRNAYKARRGQITAPHSRIKEEVAKLLSKAGFLGEVKIEGEVPSKKITATLIYHQGQPILSHIARVSTPSVRTYARASRIPVTLSGRGITILSTSKGLMTNKDAKKARLGGEIICRIW